jgi:hypothetical protein
MAKVYKSSIVLWFLVITSAAFAAKVSFDMLSIPDVHTSYSTNACVKVINYNETDSYSCEYLPAKYNHVWVK